MRPVRSRIVTALVLAVLMLGSLASVADADQLSTGGLTLAPTAAQPVQSTTFSADLSSGKVASPMAFPEDPWPGLSQAINSFPEDPWPGLSN
jgi:hypothetical protein